MIKMKSNTLSAIIAASIIAAAPVSDAGQGWFNKLFVQKEKEEKIDKNVLLVEKVEDKYNKKEEEYNGNENRKRDYVWDFYSLKNMPPRKNKLSSGDRNYSAVYKHANNTSNAVCYPDSNNAIIGIKAYYRSFTGQVNNFYYVAEKYLFNENKEEWMYNGTYHVCRTDIRNQPIVKKKNPWWNFK